MAAPSPTTFGLPRRTSGGQPSHPAMPARSGRSALSARVPLPPLLLCFLGRRHRDSRAPDPLPVPLRAGVQGFGTAGVGGLSELSLYPHPGRCPKGTSPRQRREGLAGTTPPGVAKGRGPGQDAERTLQWDRTPEWRGTQEWGTGFSGGVSEHLLQPNCISKPRAGRGLGPWSSPQVGGLDQLRISCWWSVPLLLPLLCVCVCVTGLTVWSLLD